MFIKNIRLIKVDTVFKPLTLVNPTCTKAFLELRFFRSNIQ